jgi:hypothetical protein
MMQRVRSSSSSTAAVLWLMILLVFLPIAIGHVVARSTADGPQQSGAVQAAPGSRAG